MRPPFALVLVPRIRSSFLVLEHGAESPAKGILGPQDTANLDLARTVTRELDQPVLTLSSRVRAAIATASRSISPGEQSSGSNCYRISVDQPR